MSRRMLVVDDEETIRWALQELFMSDGWEVHCAEDGSAGAPRLKQETYDYLVTDLKMAGRSGLELAREALSEDPDLGVTILTGYATLESALEALRLRVWDYRTKPCDVNALKQRVEDFMDARESSFTPGRRLSEPLGQEDVADFLAGGGTQCLSVDVHPASAGAEQLLVRICAVLTDLGLAQQRISQLTQVLVEALARSPHNGGHCRVGALKGHVLLTLTVKGDLADRWREVTQALGPEFAQDARIVATGDRCSMVLDEAI